MATILITGGTGLIGEALTRLLIGRGHKVIILTREPQGRQGPATYLAWNVKTRQFPVSALEETDVIVHLAGANVGEGRWTARRKEEILRSRVDSSTLLVETLQAHPNKVRAVISASALGFYGPDRGHPFMETDPPFADFLGNTCRLWEESLQPIRGMGKRLVILRTGIVLAREGGAFPSFRRPLLAGIGTILGGGKQIISWIHLLDICRLYLHAIENERLDGVFNGAAPQPVSNKTLILALAARMRGRFYIPVHVPGFVLKMLLGEMSIEVLKSCTTDARKIASTGFQFVYPSIDGALMELTAKA